MRLEQFREKAGAAVKAVRRTGTILVVEDDPEIRDLLELFLQDEGYRAATAPDGIAALDLVTRGRIRPDLVLADYNLPNGMDGLQLAAKLRERLQVEVPVVILTGDTSTGTARDIARHNCMQLNKPIKLKELTQAIQRLIAAAPAAMPARPAPAAGDPKQPIIFVVDDDRRYPRGHPRRARGRRPNRRGLRIVRGLPRSLSSRWRSMPLDRRLPARHEWARIVAAARAKPAISCRPS